jgi:2-oxoglutarate ferredoxin oxidoreductase subunit alpha
MSRIRGGNNFYQIRISDQPVTASREHVQLLLCLDTRSHVLHGDRVAKEGWIIIDKEGNGISGTDGRYLDVPFKTIVKDAGGQKQLTSAVGLGLLAGFLGMEFSNVESIIKETFSQKGSSVVSQNIKCALRGHAIGIQPPFSLKEKLKPSVDFKKAVVSGNDAIALGAIAAGCGFYSAYPMSPSTTVMEKIAHFSEQFGIVVEQAEDEIAAVNMAIGASFAGVRAMTGTSGGGFALMTEGLSLAAMTETPVVILDSQRPAPATGFPTRTEQADLGMVIHAGHGEFARVVFAPGTAEQAFSITQKAFEIAEQYQVPVIILSDQYLADSQIDVDARILSAKPNTRHIISREDSANVTDYKRYRLSQDNSGISPRAVPSWINDVMYVGSDEHTEKGHITEDGEIRKKMVGKRLYEKMSALEDQAMEPTVAGIDSARIVIGGFGSTFGLLKEAVESKSDTDTGFMHFSQVWPLPRRTLLAFREKNKDCKFFTVENNATGQLARLIWAETGIKIDGSILKYNGRPFTLDELLKRIEELDSVNHE